MDKSEAKRLAGLAVQAAIDHGLLDQWGDECVVFGVQDSYGQKIALEAMAHLQAPNTRSLILEGAGLLYRAPRPAVEQCMAISTAEHAPGSRPLVILYDDGAETVILHFGWLPASALRGGAA